MLMMKRKIKKFTRLPPHYHSSLKMFISIIITNLSICRSQSSMSNSMKPGYPAPPPPGRVYGMMGAQEMSALGAMHKFVTAQTLLEYRWPLEGKDSEHYFLQEQVSEYLGVKSFKRRYPDVQRRQVDHEERDFLVEMKVVNVTQADLGLTAIPSVQVSYHIFTCYIST